MIRYPSRRLLLRSTSSSRSPALLSEPLSSMEFTYRQAGRPSLLPVEWSEDGVRHS